MTTTSAHIWQSSETYRWNTGDVLGRGATAVVYKARHLVCIHNKSIYYYLIEYIQALRLV